MRWRTMLVKATDEAVRSLAVAAQQLLPDLKNPIDVSLLSMRLNREHPWVALHFVQHINRGMECAGTPTWVASAFPQPVFQAGAGRECRQELSRDPQVGLAWLLSRITGEAMYLICSDMLCCSGHVHFRAAELVSGQIYGWEGSGELWELTPSAFGSEEIQLGEVEYDFTSPAAEGLRRVVGPGADEAFLAPDESQSVWLRYRIMLNRQPVAAESITGVPNSGS